MDLEFHEAAEEFPLLNETRLNELADDIESNGLREPICLFDNKILDGRNRYKACQLKKIKPRFESLPSDIDPFSYVWSLNGERRDLSADHRYLIWKSCTEKSEWWQKEQKRIQEEANRKRAEAAREQENRGNQYTKPQGEQEVEVVEQVVPPPAKEHKTRQAKAAASKTNRGAVERMDRLDRERPDLSRKVRSGELKPTEALRIMKKESVAGKISELPKDKYLVIYADPPWSYNDKLGGDLSPSYGAAEKHYPSMSLSELKVLDVPSLCQDNAVLFLWTTSPLLPEGLELCRAWGFKYKAQFIWDKVRHNMGHYNSVRHEHLLICTKGSCTPQNVKLLDSVQSIEKSNKHSQKPEEFREIIDTLYPEGPRIELFRRGDAPKNWHVWGNEANERTNPN